MEPASGRASNRISEREFDGIPARVLTARFEVPVKLWDYSPFGFAFLYSHSVKHPFAAKEGDALRVSLALGPDKVTADCVVENTSLFRGCTRIGMSRRDLQAPLGPHGEEAFKLPPAAGLILEIGNPLLYGEWSRLEAAAVLPGPRFACVSRDPGLLLFAGQVLDLELGLPGAGRYACRAEVKALGRHDSSAVALILAPAPMPPKAAEELGALLAREAGASPETLRALGIPARLSRERLEFRLAAGPEDLAAVAALRREAFPENGRGPGRRAAEGSKVREGRVLCAFHEGALAAAATFVLPESDRAVLRAEAAFPGGQFPCVVPHKTSLFEITGVAYHRDFRRESLLRAMLEQCARAFLLSGRRHILMLADADLLPVFRSLGFQKLGASCERNGGAHHLMRLDADSVLTGKRMAFPLWCSLFGDVIEDLAGKGLVAFTPWQGFLMRAKLGLKPFLQRAATARVDGVIRRFLALRNGEP